ncbi:hypothetical protein XENTR_v10001462 [Xenopus tropicalis]|nr:hypothetical protein XENTR_v10001462 [Xenopus tropicalis]
MSTSIPLESDSIYLVTKDTIQDVLSSNFQDLHIQLGPRELTLNGHPKDLLNARKIIKNITDSVISKTVDLPSNIKNFINKQDKKALSKKLFENIQEGCIILDSSQGLHLYAPSVALLKEAENVLGNAFLEKNICIQKDNRKVTSSEPWRSLLEDIKNNQCLEIYSNETKKGSLILYLLGFREEVETAHEILDNHLDQQLTVQKEINLENRVVVEHLDELIDGFSLGVLEVDVKILRSSSSSVTLTGPKNAVKKAIEVLNNVKQKICHQHLCIPKYGAKYFFKTQGKEMLENLCKDHNCKVFICEPEEACSEDECKNTDDFGSMHNVTMMETTFGSKESKEPMVQLALSFGNLEDQKANVICVPLLATNPELTSLNVTKSLENKAGSKLSKLFTALLNGRTRLLPGSLLEMPLSKDTHVLDCDTVIFIVCTPWDGPDGSSTKVLREAISAFLQKCSKQKFNLVTMAAIGVGKTLHFPNQTAARIFGEGFKAFMESEPNTSLKKINLVFQKKSDILFHAYKDTLLHMDLGDRVVVCDENGGAFHKRPFGEHIDVTVGNLFVSVVYGNIAEEKTDIILNLTNFREWKAGSVAHAIFTGAGPEIIEKVQQESKQTFVTTVSGNLKSKYIFHTNCQNNFAKIKDIARNTLLKCEEMGLHSVAMPAIGTGECMLDVQQVAKSMADSISSVARNSKLYSLFCVRLVMLEPYVYSIFSTEFQQRFTLEQQSSWNPLNLLTARLKRRQAKDTEDIKDSGSPITMPQHSVDILDVVGLDREAVDNMKLILKLEFDNQYQEEIIEDPQVKSFSEMEVQNIFSVLKEKPEVQIMLNKREGCIQVNGCHLNVMKAAAQVQEKLRAILNSRLEEAKRDQSMTHWVYTDGDIMVPFEEEPSQKLENKFLSGFKGVVTVALKDGKEVTVNLETMKASILNLGKVVPVARKDLALESDLPAYWEEMNRHFLMMVPLDPNTEEYCKVHADFTKTVHNCEIVKIERIQNRYQYKAYTVRKNYMIEKNGAADVNERILYHGTTFTNCHSINYSGFSRSFAGQNATAYGRGVYFAVNAIYSAGIQYSPRDPETQLRYIYQVKVLAGHHTLGKRDMRAPPCKSTTTTYENAVCHKGSSMQVNK